MYVVLQTPYFEEIALRSYLARLAVSVEAQVLNTYPESYEGPPNQELIFSGSVQEGEDPLIIVQGPDGNDSTETDGHILVIWKLPIVLIRPARLRLQNPCLDLSASASLKPAETIHAVAVKDEYLPSQVPSGLNLLESFSNDPGLGQVKPRLSALRVSRVIPATQVSKELFRPIRSISSQPVKIVPAFGIRTRYTRPNNTPNSSTIVASLDLEITPFAGPEVVLEQVNFDVAEAIVEDLNKVQGMVLPMTCLPRDDITFLYRLRPDELDSGKSNVKPVQISVTAKVKISDSSQPRISMHWTTSVDFTVPVNPGYGPASQSLRRDHRPAQLTLGSTLETAPTVASLAVSRPDALPSIELITRHQRSASVPDFGVTMTFTNTGADVVKRGQIFTWEVFIVNRSDRARKLALIIIPKRRRAEHINTNRPPSTTFGRKDPNVADAVLDENILHAMQKNSTIEATEIICYSTDVRIGPLAPSACHTVELRFMALKSGVIGLEAIRVVDLANQEHVDIRDLPSIVVSAE